MWIVLLVEIMTSGKEAYKRPIPSLFQFIDDLPVRRFFAQLAVVAASAEAQGDRLAAQVVDDDHLPAVDILITYCGEGDEIVLNTAKAACACDYPSELLRVVVLDDSHSHKLAGKVGDLSRRFPNLYYASRNLAVKSHSKAANLNFGIRYLESLERGEKAPFLAVLDADMIPAPNWLRSVLPHVLNNDRAALACPFQHYYNVPAGDLLNSKAEMLPLESANLLQDFSDNAWCLGTGFVMRVAALEAIGGIPDTSLQEDVLMTSYLASAGWHCVYVPEPVQWGLAPDTMAAFLKQCQRWTVGIISVANLEFSSGKTGDSSRKKEKRLNVTMFGVLICVEAFVWTFALLALPLCVLSGNPLIPPPSPQAGQRRLLLRLATLDFLTQMIYHMVLSSVLDWRLPLHGIPTQVWTQPWRMMIVLRYFLAPKILGRDRPDFTPSGIRSDGDAERAARGAKRSRLASCKVVLWDCSAWPHLAIFGICIAGAGVRLAQAWGKVSGEDDVRELDLGVLTGIAWPPVLLLWATLTKAAWLPVAYGLWPPPLAAQDTLLSRDGKRDVEYPSEKVKREYLSRPEQWSFVVKCVVYLVSLVAVETSRI